MTAQENQRPRSVYLVSQLPIDRQGLATVDLAFLVITRIERQAARGVERSSPRSGRGIRSTLERPLCPPQAFGTVTIIEPKVPQGAHQPQSQLSLALSK